MAVFVLIALSAFYIQLHYVLLSDPDTWWHIKTGQDIITNLRVPVTDNYSYTYAGHPWIAKEWLSQVLLAAVYNVGGWNGVLLLTAVATAAAPALLGFEFSKSVRPLFAGIAALLIGLFIVPVVIARPQVFTFAIAVVFTTSLFRAAESKKAPNWWFLLLIALWTNLHGSFTLSFVIAGFAFLHFCESTRLDNPSLTLRWLIFLALCPVASLFNPYGFQPLLINLGFVAGLPVMDLITEWQPFNAAAAPLVEFGIMLVLGILIGTGTRISVSKTLFILFTFHMMLIHLRFIYVFFLLVPVIAVREIGSQNSFLSHWKPLFQPMFGRLLNRFHWPILAAAIAASFAVFFITAGSGPFAPPPERQIAGALAYAKSHALTGPVFNSYDVGGPLILNDIKTFIDGRAEQIFLGNFMTNYIASGKPGGANVLSSILDTYKIKWAVFVPNDRRKDFMMEMPHWKMTYSDDYATIFETF